jgi:Reverse transcriptase (RNA-dependent DNA polymerase)
MTSTAMSASSSRLCLDLSAAFDKSMLIARLRRSFGDEEVAFDWITSYRSDRSQHFRVASSRSPLSFCEHGVPQGSTLGLILFSLYITPAANVISAVNLNHHQYAGDTQLYITLDYINAGDTCSLTPSPPPARQQSVAGSFSTVSPSTHINLKPSCLEPLMPPDIPLTVSIANAIIPVSPTLKSLVVTLDSKLSFQQHINSVCKACYFHLHSMRHVRSCLSPTTNPTDMHLQHHQC